jgi:hypothetical protein
MAFDQGPFAILTLMAAPAVLTNASALLSMGTSNRFGRAVDRARSLAALLERPGMLESAEGKIRHRQFERTHLRTILLLRALSSFYISLSSFAISSLVALVGAIAGQFSHGTGTSLAALLAALAGATGVASLGIGCSLLVRETRLAVVSIAEEDQVIRGRLSSAAAPGKT